MLRFLILLLFFLFISELTHAEIRIHSHAFEPSTITVGDPIHLRLLVEADAKQNIYFEPIDVRQLEQLEADSPKAKRMRSRKSVPQRPGEGNVFYEVVYPLRAFIPGEYILPPIAITVTDANGSTASIQTPPYTFTVQSTRPPNAAGMRDIKPPFDSTELSGRYIVVGTVLAFALLAALIFIYFRRRAQAIRTIPEVPAEPLPHEIAYQQLKGLDDKNLMAHGEVKAYHIEISQIIRQYIDARYELPALELTTDDLLQHLIHTRLPEANFKLIQDFFENCDLVKFAKYQPNETEVHARMMEARRIVEVTTSPSVS